MRKDHTEQNEGNLKMESFQKMHRKTFGAIWFLAFNEFHLKMNEMNYQDCSELARRYLVADHSRQMKGKCWPPVNSGKY